MKHLITTADFTNKEILELYKDDFATNPMSAAMIAYVAVCEIDSAYTNFFWTFL